MVLGLSRFQVRTKPHQKLLLVMLKVEKNHYHFATFILWFSQNCRNTLYIFNKNFS